MASGSMAGARLAAMVAAAGLAVVLAAGGSAPAVAHDRDQARLGTIIQEALRAEGPYFTAEERSVIERHCGYAPGSWDGFEMNVHGRTLVCRDGRRADHPEVRAVIEAAAPRIARRVEAAMASPRVRAAIDEVARDAEARALAALEDGRLVEARAREAAARARAAAARAGRRESD